VPVLPEEGYPGKVDKDGNPKDMDDYNTWIESLPKVWQNNSFHNHFVYVDPDITDAEIVLLLRDSLDEFGAIWSSGEDILKVWKSKRKLVPGDMSSENITRCGLKALDVVSRATEYLVREEKWLL